MSLTNMSPTELLNYGLGTVITVIVFYFVYINAGKLIDAVVDFIKQSTLNSKRISEKNEKHIETLIKENKKNTEEYKDELAKSNLINLEIAESNKKQTETIERASESMEIAIRTIEYLSNTHANMLYNMNHEVRELKETQARNHTELLSLINKKSGD